jgi:hypothetical protein
MANSYERIRHVIIDTIKETREGQFDGLKEFVAATLAEQSGDASSERTYIFGARLSYEDSRMFTEVFWELFREGIITLGQESRVTLSPGPDAPGTTSPAPCQLSHNTLRNAPYPAAGLGVLDRGHHRSPPFLFAREHFGWRLLLIFYRTLSFLSSQRCNSSVERNNEQGET